MKFQRSDQLHPAGFNITPLIDILLVLIIFFVLTWNFSRDEKELSIQVPSATESKDSKIYPGEIVLNVLPDGGVILNGTKRDPEALKAILQTMSTDFGDELVVIIRADKAVPYQHIIGVLDLCRGAEITNVSFATEAEEGKS